ncbi:acyl-CoA thioesterase [Nonomuraea wenchangensis]|uniref:acyl-CoA thioesterase n=1 Tax=Nonomuraea wenchangensis TaxID=568860 RepID=UPI00331E2717
MSVHRVGGVVAFHETDASGRYHYTNALKWAENAEHVLYRSVGLPVARFPRRTVRASFERPLADGAEYVVELRVEALGNTSITYRWRILDAEHVAVSGAHTVVHLDDSGKPGRVPDVLRAVLHDLMDDPA